MGGGGQAEEAKKKIQAQVAFMGSWSGGAYATVCLGWGV